ncbi:MAG: hypothetical protein ACFE78_10520 [Candidatus Hodarchaeota archaeon]
MKRIFELNEDQRISKRYEGIGVSFFIKKYITIHQKLRENLNNSAGTKNNQTYQNFNKK